MKLKELEPLLHGTTSIQVEEDGTIQCMPATALVRRAYADYTIVSLKATPDPIDPDILIILITLGKQDTAQGHWSSKMVLVQDMMGNCHAGFKCSECGAVLNKTNYCGNCGAKMIDEEDR